MFYILLTLDMTKDNMKRNSYLFTVMIHALIMKKQQYDCFMVAQPMLMSELL